MDKNHSTKAFATPAQEKGAITPPPTVGHGNSGGSLSQEGTLRAEPNWTDKFNEKGANPLAALHLTPETLLKVLTGGLDKVNFEEGLTGEQLKAAVTTADQLGEFLLGIELAARVAAADGKLEASELVATVGFMAHEQFKGVKVGFEAIKFARDLMEKANVTDPDHEVLAGLAALSEKLLFGPQAKIGSNLLAPYTDNVPAPYQGEGTPPPPGADLPKLAPQ